MTAVERLPPKNVMPSPKRQPAYYLIISVIDMQAEIRADELNISDVKRRYGARRLLSSADASDVDMMSYHRHCRA